MLPKFWSFLLLTLAGVKAQAIGNVTNTKTGLKIQSNSTLHSMSHEDFPLVFSLRRQENGTWVHRCSASVINDEYLLTAARCLYAGKCEDVEDEYCHLFPAYDLKVVAGPNVLNQQINASYEVESYVIHPNFYTTESAEANIAILRIKDLLELSELKARPVRLGAGIDRNLSKGKATLVQWQRLEGHSHPILRTAEVSLVSHDKCKVQYNRMASYNYHSDKMGCMRSNTGLRSCNFNAGSPVMFNGRQVGIWFLPSNATCSFRKTYMYLSIPTYLKWINKNTK